MRPEAADRLERIDVPILGEPTSYLDGAEQGLTEIMSRARDRSSLSDELARHIHDWPTRYHLARERSNLVRPLHIVDGMRVLDLGAGTGAVSRYLAEAGAEVFVLEGSLERARVAALRCDDLDNVRVACGTPDDLDDDEQFDVVVAVGVLEYAGAEIGGARGAAAMLRQARRRLRPDGALVVAIENQLGLKYLLGYPEDHVGEPWVGLAGYPGHEVRTWSRRVLADLLEEAGFPAQRWLFPFPDYKLPSVVLSEAAYAIPDAADLVDQIVSTPIREFAFDVEPPCDERAAHREFVRAGLGADVANSFLVVAAHDDAEVATIVPDDVVGWIFDRERLRKWRRVRRLRRAGTDLVVETERIDGGHAPVTDLWLTQAIEAGEPYHRGLTLEQRLREACNRRDVGASQEVLRRWWHALETQARSGSTNTRPSSNPFAGADSDRRLPDDHLDVGLGNFVDGQTPDLVRVDREWHAAGGVSLDLVGLRAILYFVEGLLVTGGAHPWSASPTRGDLVVEIARLTGIEAPDRRMRALQQAEAEFQSLVTGGDASNIAADLDALMREPLAGATPSTAVSSGRRRRWWHR